MSEKSALFPRPHAALGAHLALALAVGAALTLGACTSSSSTSAGRDQQSNQSVTAGDAQADTPSIPARGEWKIDHGAWAELGYQWQWTGYPPLQPGATIEHARAYNDLLTFMGSASTISVLEASTGKVRWSRQLDRRTTRFVDPVRRDETLYAASDTALWELNLTNGNTIDRDDLGTLINTSPLISGNLAIFGTLSGELFAWQMENDFKLWSYKFDGPINVPAIQIDDKYIAAVSGKGEVRTLESANAHTGMSVRIAGGTDADLLTDGLGLYIASLDQSIYAFDTTDGFRFWRIRSSAPVTVQHTLYQGVIYATTRDKGLMAIDSATGEVIWNNTETGGWALTVVGEHELIVWSGYEMLSIDKDRGDIIARLPLADVSGVRTDSLTDGNIYVITNEGSVAKFGLRN